ncbi:MAG: fructoselysine kinase [Alphaproteobacteria bacterium]|nr:fructoselysine kinase [Alphaproteobacteria bacterium]
MPAILGLGDNTIDTYVSSGEQFPGGNAVNVAVLARRLGARASYLGCWGDDEGGAILRAALAAEGVDISHVREVAGGETARAHIAHEDGDRRFLGARPGVRGRYALDDASLAFATAHDLVHTSCNADLDGAIARVAGAARLLSYDYSEKWTDARLAATLGHVDIAFLSAPGRDDADCAALLARIAAAPRAAGRPGPPRIAIATRGAAGAMARMGDEMRAVAAAPARVVDTLGAGDGFIAGFLVAHLGGAALDAALAAGAQAAAEVCGWRGAFGHARPWREEAAGR